MENTASPLPTHLDIGLSKEDQERIEALRKSGKKLRKGSWYERVNSYLAGLTPIKLKDKVVFFQLLATMINAGVPLIRSLLVLAMQTKNPRFQGVMRDLAKQMEQGSSLSVAMEKYDGIFNESERGMIASGEASGNLNDILVDIARQAEKSAMILSKVKGAMIYPVTILGIMAIALFLILTMVVPQFTELFLDSGQELPSSTQALITASDWARNYWFIGIGILLLLAGGFVLVRRSQRGRYSIDLALLYVPIFGRLVRQLMVARFARQMSSLMNAGVPIVKALEINANAVGNAVYKQRIEFASQDVAQGIPLGENLKNTEFLFPPMVSSMVLVGEQTANLHEVAAKIALHYESEVDTAVASLSKLMEPVILVVMGGLVGFLVAAIMSPIMALSDLSSLV